MNETLQTLKARLATIADLRATSAVLNWDQQTYMPAGGNDSRAEVLATVSRLAHEFATSSELGELLDKLDGQLDPETDDGALVRVVRRDYANETKLPSDLVERITRAAALSEHAWVEARTNNDWSHFAPHLAGLVELQKETAACYNPDVHPFDALIQVYEPGMTKDQISAMYEELKTGTLPLIAAVREQADPERSKPLFNSFPEPLQEKFGLSVIQKFGFDLTRGRQDRTVHPFCTHFSMNDVRLTTRFDEGWISPALFGTLHEAGHGMYEQNVAQNLTRTPLANGCSMSIHESQSRLWENLVGRSRPFWEHFYPELQAVYPLQLGEVSLERFYRAINTAEPSLIRVEADELTYNLHTLLRFELELALLDGQLNVNDLPAAWNAKVEEYLGLTPPNDAEGALQDVHWSAGLFAYFPTYTLGNVLSVQFFEAALAAHPNIIDDMRKGEFGDLLNWLSQNIYQHGRKFDPNTLIERATGRPMDAVPYVNYLKTKFGELYQF